MCDVAYDLSGIKRMFRDRNADHLRMTCTSAHLSPTVLNNAIELDFLDESRCMRIKDFNKALM